VTEYYSKNGRHFIENVVSATNLANNLAAVDMESIQQLTDTGGKHWRFGVEYKNTNQFTSRTIKIQKPEVITYRQTGLNATEWREKLGLESLQPYLLRLHVPHLIISKL